VRACVDALGLKGRACVDCECNFSSFLTLIQCLRRLRPLTVTSASGMSPQLPLCIKVSRNVYWRMT
jgi:hypothetical protein